MNGNITLIRTPGGYMARYSDPYVMEVLGTDTLPTPYMANAPEELVLASIKARNPDAVVTMEGQS